MSHAIGTTLNAPAAQPLRFERRSAPRQSLSGRAAAIRLSCDHFGRLHHLDLLDWSPGGLSATSEHAIEPGTTLSIGFALPGPPAARGTVTRCTPCGRGYVLGVRFERRRAA